MKEYKINIDLFCYRTENDGNKDYRLYVDNDLITERTYIWMNKTPVKPYGQFVRENVWVELEPGEHEIRIEAVNSKFNGFLIRNIKIDNNPVSLTSTGRFIISE